MKRFRWRWWLPIAVLITLIVAVIIIIKIGSSPASGVTTDGPGAPTPTPKPTPSPIAFHDQYLSFNYPYFFQTVPAHGQVNVLDEWRLLGSDQSSTSTEVNGTVTYSSLADDTSYTYRTKHPELYKITAQTIDGQTVTIATNVASGTEVVAFWPHNARLATLAITGAIGNDKLMGELQVMLSSLHWNS